jgi:hypothetical protein
MWYLECQSFRATFFCFASPMQLSNSLLDNFSLRPGIGKRAHAFEIAGEKTALPLARRAWCWPLPSSW